MNRDKRSDDNRSDDNRTDDIPVPAPLVKVTRGSLTESRHRGHIVAVDGDGQIVAQLGAPETVTFLRSSSKPHQALPFVAQGAASRFGFTEREIAIACGSHGGERVHTETVASMLRRTGLDVSDLKCGAHEPYNKETAAHLRREGAKPTALHNNCSGKHAAMLALALHLGASVTDYYEPSSPVQLAIGHTIAQFADTPIEDISVGTDGCGVPTFGVTVRAMALMSVRLVAPLSDWDEATREACRTLVNAMSAHPEMIEGDGELDTELMRQTGRRLISKVGAEGVYTAGILPSERWPRGLGLAFKIEDGDKKERARPVVVIESLRQLGVLQESDADALARFAKSDVTNNRGEQVGEVLPDFELKISS